MAEISNKLVIWIKRLFGQAQCTVGPYGAVPWRVERRDNCVIYSGTYSIHGGGSIIRQVQGRIIEWPGLPTDVYVFNPPADLRKHPKGHCLQLATPNSAWFKLHWQKPARDFDTSRAYLEQLLNEVARRRI